MCESELNKCKDNLLLYRCKILGSAHQHAHLGQDFNGVTSYVCDILLPLSYIATPTHVHVHTWFVLTFEYLMCCNCTCVIWWLVRDLVIPCFVVVQLHPCTESVSISYIALPELQVLWSAIADYVQYYMHYT